MIQNNNNNLKVKVFVGLLALLVFSMSAFAYICANYSESAFTGEEKVASVKANVVKSAEAFLKSYAGFLVFLSKVERSAVDKVNCSELSETLPNAVLNMAGARDTYFALLQEAEVSPFNKRVIKKLKKFDYRGFRQEKSLDRTAFKKVARYLKKGDVKGMYNHLLLNIQDILEQLEKINTRIEKNRFPEIPCLWELNSKFSNSWIFEQYAAMIFNEIIMDK